MEKIIKGDIIEVYSQKEIVKKSGEKVIVQEILIEQKDGNGKLLIKLYGNKNKFNKLGV